MKSNFCLYEQATGAFTLKTPLPARFVGYSGKGSGRNNPAMQAMIGHGPIPRGTYRIGMAFNHARLGPCCLRLTPDPTNKMHGRSGFLIHGDNSVGDASNGCIILPRHARDLLARHVAKGELRVLQVVGLDRDDTF